MCAAFLLGISLQSEYAAGQTLHPRKGRRIETSSIFSVYGNGTEKARLIRYASISTANASYGLTHSASGREPA